MGWIANFEWIDKLGWMADYRAKNELTFWLKFWYLQSAFTELEHNTQNKKKWGRAEFQNIYVNMLHLKLKWVEIYLIYLGLKKEKMCFAEISILKI